MAVATYRLGQVAELVGVSVDTVRRWADAGRLPTTRTDGGQRLVDGAELARFLHDNTTVPDADVVVSRSARNRFPGIVTRVVKDGVTAQVDIAAAGHRIVSLMTREAADELGLEPGVLAVAAVKSTNVVVELPPVRAVLAVLALVGAGCAWDPPTTLHVLAAASLTEAFSELGRTFEAQRPGAGVRFSFAASSTLSRQVVQGSPGDVLATADDATMAPVVDRGRAATDPTVFARNRLAIVVAPGNPQRVASLDDLARPGLTVVLCAPEAPCGRAAAEALDRATGQVRPASQEEDVKAVVSRVGLGEADAGVAYVTDARAAAGSVDTVEVPDSQNVVTAYPIVALRDTGPARAWVDHVLSPHGQQVLARFGFAPAERPPAPAVALAAVAAAFILLPVAGLLWRAPWSGLGGDLWSPGIRTALRLSLVCSLWATALSVAFGVPLAWVLARVAFPGRRLLRALTLLPMVFPPVVGGVALLLAFGRQGLVGRWLFDAFGLQLAFTTPGAVLAETFVAMPFLVVPAEASFRSLDRRYEEAARTLGAGRWTAFRRVTLPLAGPALAAGAVLCWARALGEFGATITFAGNTPGRTSTVPLQVYLLLESGKLEAAVALSLVLLAVSVAVLVGLRDRWLGAA